MDRIERRLDATTKIVQTGMKMLVKMEEENREWKKRTEHAIHALIAAQMRAEARQGRLDARLDQFIRSMGRRNGSNGQNGGGNH